jgi:Fuc2NAc and GlcNAc transferase
VVLAIGAVMKGQYIILLISSIILSGAGAWFISKYGHQLDLLDRPKRRSSHRTTTPRGGGVGILAGFIAVAIALKLPVSFWLPASCLSAISFMSDRFEILPLYRLLFQFAAGIIFLAGIWNGHPFHFLGYFWMFLLSVFIVGTANYYNFMDGINGIAGITGAIGFGLLSFYSYSLPENSNMAILSLCLSLCCLGFLPFNFPRARVFMGDVGSILLGFVFAAIVISLSRTIIEFICLSSFLFPFYADEFTTELKRLKDGEKIWLPHRKHFYQLLANEYAIPHWKISLGYGLGQLLVGISILYFIDTGLLFVLSIFFLYFLIFTLLSGFMRKRLIHKQGS